MQRNLRTRLATAGAIPWGSLLHFHVQVNRAEQKSLLIIAHFRVALSLSIKARPGAQPSYENEFNLHVNEISFSYEKMGTKTRFEEETKGNSEMAYYVSDFVDDNSQASQSCQELFKCVC